MKSYLEFEKEIKDLEEEMQKLKDPFNKDGISEVDTKNINRIESEINAKLKKSYENLNEWQKTQVARHEERPKAKFFIDNLFENFINLSGDRKFSEDDAILAGFATFQKKSVFVSVLCCSSVASARCAKTLIFNQGLICSHSSSNWCIFLGCLMHLA